MREDWREQPVEVDDLSHGGLLRDAPGILTVTWKADADYAEPAGHH